MNELHKQGGQLLNVLVEQITGKRTTPLTSNAEYVSTFTSLRNYFADDNEFFDTILTTFHRQFAKMLYATRDYERKLKILEMDSQEFADLVEKVRIFDRTIDRNDARQGSYENPDQEAPNPYLKKDVVAIKTGLGGSVDYQDRITTYKDRLNAIMVNSAELARFYSECMNAWRNKWNLYFDAFKQNTFNTFVMDTVKNATENNHKVVHLFTDYNNEMGYQSGDALFVTEQNWMHPEILKYYAPWVKIKIAEVIKDMTSYNVYGNLKLVATAPDGYEMQWKSNTPESEQKAVFADKFMTMMENYAPTDMHSPSYMKDVQVERVPDFGSLNNKMWLFANNYHVGDENGNVEVQNTATNAKVAGIIFDRRAVGVTVMNEWESTAGLNPADGSLTTWIHKTCRGWTDIYEKAVAFTLD